MPSMIDLREILRIQAPEPVRALRFSPDGRWLVALPQSGRSVRVYESNGRAWRARGTVAGHGLRRSTILNVEFHPEGLLVVTGEAHRIEVWDVAAQRLVREFGSRTPADPERILAYEGLGISPDGRYVETSFLGRNRGERYQWDTGELVATRWGRSGPFVFHPEGELLAVGAVDHEYHSQVQFCSWSGGVYVWYPPVLGAYMAVGRAVFSPDGRAFAMIGGVDMHWCQVHSFPECTVAFRHELGSLEELRFPYEITEALCYAGSVLLAGRVDGTVIAIEEDGSIAFEHPAHGTRVMTIERHPSAPWIATGSQDGEIILWAAEGMAPGRAGGAEEGVTRRFVESFPPFPAGQWRDLDADEDLLFAPED
jgi:WD40 repeat protein